MREKVEEALNKIRPMLAADGGDVELVDVNDGIVQIRLAGACGGCIEDCPLADGAGGWDLGIMIEELLKQEVPEIKEVVNLEEI